MKRLCSWRIVAVLLAVALSMAVHAHAAPTVLDVGSSGTNVIKVQKRLIQYDYMSGTADGKYGQNTRDAVRLFQQRNGLSVDGRVGATTAAALGVTLSGGSTTSTAVATSAAIASSDHRLLARLVHAEARGEPYKGMVAVAAVVLNRVRSSQFPNTISGVIYQKNAFSCINDGQINLAPSNDAIRAARDAMNGWDPTGGCLYFYNPKGTKDKWIRTRTVKTVIGNHHFAT